MPAPSDALIKSWARIDGTEFDAVLPTMIAAAAAMASHECGVDFVTNAMPEAVQQWVCAQVSHWINNPDAATERQMFKSPFVDRLLDAYRTYYVAPAA